MATLKDKIKAELTFRAMVDHEGLPEPDRIEYGDGCIRALWTQSKVAVVIDIDELDGELETLEDLGLDPTDLGDEGLIGLDDAA